LLAIIEMLLKGCGCLLGVTIEDGIAALRLERAVELSLQRNAPVRLVEATDDVSE